MRLSPTVADELHHKMTIVRDEPDLLTCYEITPGVCDMIIGWCLDKDIPADIPVRFLLLMAGEMENAAEITEEQAASAPVNEPKMRNRIRYAARSYRGFVSAMNERLAQHGERVIWTDEPETIPALPPLVNHDLAHVYYVATDGGRAEAGFKGATGDCACRAVTIATGRPYREVYDRINELAKRERTGKRKKGKSDARLGVYRPLMHRMLEEYGFSWTPLMQIGSGCTVHLHRDELPLTGTLVLSLSRHYAAYIDGKLYDTYDSSRGGTRCVYGYWKLEDGS